MNTRLGVLLGLAALALVAVQPASADQVFFYTNFGGSTSVPGSIQKLDVTTSTNTTVVSGLTTPDSLIFSNPTTIIYTQTNTNTVNQVNSDGTGRMVIASSNLNFPEDIALDPGGLSVVVSDSRNDNVVRVGLAPPHTETFLPTLGGPVLGIVYDGSGHLFVNVSASQGPEIVQLDPLTGAVLKSLPLPSKGDGLTYDPSTNTLWAAAPDTTGVIQIADDLSSAVEFDCPNLNDTTLCGNYDGLEADGNGHLFIANNIGYIDRYNIASHTFSVVASAPNIDDLAPIIGPGSPPPTSTTTPEPASALLVATGGLAMLLARKRGFAKSASIS